MDEKLVSVILPVRNGEKYVREAIESVLNQTYNHFELIIINNGSTDETNTILQSFCDNRIKIIETEDIGLVKALNLGIGIANGEYIARMDADDICMPERFSVEIKILNENEKIGMVCSDIEVINEEGRLIGYEKDIIKSQDKLLKALTFRGKMKPIIHPTVMMRKSLIDLIGGYREYDAAEDRDLWLRLAANTIFLRISMPLLKYRVTKSGISRSKFNIQKANTMLAVLNYEVKKKMAIDMFTNNPDILKHFYKVFHNYANGAKKQFIAFQQMKSRYMQAKGISKFILLISLVADYKLVYYLIKRNSDERKFINTALNNIKSYNNLHMQFFNN